MAASIKPKSMQMLPFYHHMAPDRSGLSEAEYGLRKWTGRNWRICVRVTGSGRFKLHSTRSMAQGFLFAPPLCPLAHHARAGKARLAARAHPATICPL
jgi:hypothetical protein